MRPVRIVLVDDHHVVRQGLRSLLEDEQDLAVVGTAGNGLEALQIIETEKPDVVIVDLLLPSLGGLEVTRRTRKAFPEVEVVILSMYEDEAYVLEALKNGAAAYVLKSSKADELIHAVREVHAGRRYLSAPLSERAIEDYVQERIHSDALDPYETLTNREREVLQLAAEGRSNPEAAVLLSISARTVETHRANLMRKLGLGSQSELIRYAIKRGILPLD
jgi:DNA-binding NarL/FixJ family response regulator